MRPMAGCVKPKELSRGERAGRGVDQEVSQHGLRVLQISLTYCSIEGKRRGCLETKPVEQKTLGHLRGKAKNGRTG